MANELKDEDIETITTENPKYNTTEGLVEWLKNLATIKFDSEWEAMHDKGFRKLLSKLVNQASPEELKKLGDPNDYRTKGYTYNLLKSMFDEGEKGLNRRDYNGRFRYEVPNEDWGAKKAWQKRKVYPEDIGISDASKYDELIKGKGGLEEVANQIGLDLAPNADAQQFDELKEDLSDWILDQRGFPKERLSQDDLNMKEEHLEKMPTDMRKSWENHVKKIVGANDEDELSSYTKALEDYVSKNKKGREDIPTTYKR